MIRILSYLLLLVFIGLVGCKQAPNAQAVKYAKAKGSEITSATFKALSSKLKWALKEKGYAEAISYCNVNALPITDSLATKYSVDIKRTSDKIRNQKNKATQEENAAILEYKERLLHEKDLTPIVNNRGATTTYYSPIIVQDLCLTCHGNTSDMSEYSIIKNLYPDDQAHGYTVGDLRGIWSITFYIN